MLYKEFKECKLSRLGFGAMRLPVKDGKIDQQQVEDMTDYAMSHGVNYFDTAYPYHEGLSETSIGKALSKYPRESWYLADKFPGHQIARSYYPAEIFEDQLRKCQVEYFDFYLMHNVYENSIDIYLDEKWGIKDYFIEQKRNGRIRHLGFSSHADLPALKAFLDTDFGKEMEFCQIQLNYMDWSLQNAKEKCELLKQRGLKIWVMEPVRGGKLLDIAPASMAFRWLATVPDVTMILSGMSNMAQMEDNINTFQELKPLSAEEVEHLYRECERLRDAIPCTACRYCTKDCAMGLDIPTLIHSYNDMKVQNSFTPLMRIEGLPQEKRPSACIACGKCAKVCPQHIDIPQVMKDFSEKISSVPSWADICRKREIAAERMREENKKALERKYLK